MQDQIFYVLMVYMDSNHTGNVGGRRGKSVKVKPKMLLVSDFYFYYFLSHSAFMLTCVCLMMKIH